jgi:hypothetical protein
MSDPIRVQLSRKRGWRMPPNTVKVCRPSKWGNPFRADWPEGGKDRAWAVSAFRGALTADVIAEARRELRGKNLACWCPLNEPCHADVLLEVANASLDDQPAASADTVRRDVGTELKGGES